MKNIIVAGKSLRVILPARDRARLAETCFRGTHVREAGNFFRWPNFDKMLGDKPFMERFRDVLAAAIEENAGALESGFTEPWTIPFTEPVGWTSSVPQTMVNGARLELKRTNGRSCALFVAASDTDHPAPRTNLVAMTLTIRKNFKPDTDLVAIVHTMYPGPNVGSFPEEEGDITESKGFVLFDFHHPGGDSFVELEP